MILLQEVKYLEKPYKKHCFIILFLLLNNKKQNHSPLNTIWALKFKIRKGESLLNPEKQIFKLTPI